MSKDRRLGRGLAALLGTPLDESNIIDGSATEAGEGHQSVARSPSRPSGSEAPTNSASPTRSMHLNAPPSGARPQTAPKPRAAIASNPAAGVTGSVPLSRALPAQSNSTSADNHIAQPPASGIVVNASAAATAPVSGALEIDVNLIDANPFQPRRQFNEEEIASLA